MASGEERAFDSASDHDVPTTLRPSRAARWSFLLVCLAGGVALAGQGMVAANDGDLSALLPLGAAVGAVILGGRGLVSRLTVTKEKVVMVYLFTAKVIGRRDILGVTEGTYLGKPSLYLALPSARVRVPMLLHPNSRRRLAVLRADLDEALEAEA
jgi:hypothetical protein